MLRLARSVHVTVAPRAGRRPASYRLCVAGPTGLTAALASACSGVRLHLSVEGRVSLTAPGGSGGAFRRHFTGEVVDRDDAVELCGEFATDETAVALLLTAWSCLAVALVGTLVAGAAQLVVGDPAEAAGLLASAAAPLAMSVLLALGYRVGAHAGLALQELFHEELVGLERATCAES